jgi:type IV secretion system protein VirB10
VNALPAPGEVGTAGVADAIPGERGPSAVARGRSLQARVQNALALGVVVLLGGGFLTWYYLGLAESHAEAKAKKPAAVASEVTLPPLGPAPVAVKPVQATPMVESGSAEAETLLAGSQDDTSGYGGLALASGPPAATPYSNAYAAPTQPDPVMQRKLESPVLVRGVGTYSMQPEEVQSDAALDGPLGDRPGNGSPGGGVTGGGSGGGTELAGMLRPTVTVATAAGVLPDRRWLLPKGAFIDCTLETAIDSTLPGMTSCVTATDVWSADGSVVLMERGTKLVGETRSGVAQGQKRLFVLWNEARTPMGVTVELGSPGTDALGRSGVTGEVDTHFAARFGAAILISLIDAGAAAVVAAQSDGSGSVVIAPQGASDVMGEVLRSTVNIPPTIRVAQGERVAVLVARDVSFREVYAIARR